jgi:hypothetical protein
VGRTTNGQPARILAIMSDHDEDRSERLSALPSLPGEDLVCASCGLSFAEVSVERAIQAIRLVPGEVRGVVSAMPLEVQRVRPNRECWSITEYICHLRDVYATYTIRLHRAVTEYQPMLEPLFNDLRAQRFRYNELEVKAVLPELDANVAGFLEEVSHTRNSQWSRIVTRLPGETRTARWLVRQVMHEGTHHLDDICRTMAIVSKMT